MGVILNESPHTGQPSQRAAGFITMDNTELSHSDREFLVTAITRIEDQAMSGAVHGLQCPFLLLDIKGKHIVLVILPVSGSLPKLAVVHIWRDD